MSAWRPRRAVLWALMGVALVVALGVGARSGEDRTTDERLRSLAGEVRCPTCAGQAVGSSDAPAAQAIRRRIRTEIEQGRSDEDIRDRVTAAYSDDILLTPSRSGAGGLVWAIPVAAVVVAFAGLAFAFRRWERQGPEGPSPEDRRLVDAALAPHAPVDAHGEGDGR